MQTEHVSRHNVKICFSRWHDSKGQIFYGAYRRYTALTFDYSPAVTVGFLVAEQVKATPFSHGVS